MGNSCEPQLMVGRKPRKPKGGKWSMEYERNAECGVRRGERRAERVDRPPSPSLWWTGRGLNHGAHSSAKPKPKWDNHGCTRMDTDSKQRRKAGAGRIICGRIIQSRKRKS